MLGNIKTDCGCTLFFARSCADVEVFEWGFFFFVLGLLLFFFAMASKWAITTQDFLVPKEDSLRGFRIQFRQSHWVLDGQKKKSGLVLGVDANKLLLFRKNLFVYVVRLDDTGLFYARDMDGRGGLIHGDMISQVREKHIEQMEIPDATEPVFLHSEEVDLGESDKVQLVAEAKNNSRGPSRSRPFHSHWGSFYRMKILNDYFPLGDIFAKKPGKTKVYWAKDGAYVKPPIDFELVWESKEGETQKPLSIWRIIPPIGYAALGYVVQQSGHRPKPKTESFRCVHQSLCLPGTIASSSKIESESLLSIKGELSLWPIFPRNADEGISSGSFFPYPSSQAPINPQVNCISISNCILKHGSLCALSSVLCDKVDQETMREGARVSNFSLEEVEFLYKHVFMPLSGKGSKLQQESLKIYFSLPPEAACLLFSSFSHSKDSVAFFEFVYRLSVITRGGITEKVRLSFEICDKDRDGYVSKKDIIEVIELVKKTRDLTVKDLPCMESIEKKYKVREEEDIPLSFYEFLSKGKFHTEVTQCFGLFDLLSLLLVAPMENEIFGHSLEKEEMSGTLRVREESWKLSLRGNQRVKYVSKGVQIRFGFLIITTPFKPLEVLPLSGATIQSGDDPRHFEVEGPNYSIGFEASSSKERLEWIPVLRFNSAIRSNPNSSFAPVRSGSNMKYFVCGADYMDFLVSSLNQAKERVLIVDWSLAPQVHLRRGKQFGIETRLDQILKRLADRGVEIYVLIYHNASAALDLRSEWNVSFLEELNPKQIHAIRHRETREILWSHHQKYVVIDDSISFLGGVDLCFSRYEDHRYLLADPDSNTYPGLDYQNCTYFGEQNGPSCEEQSDRAQMPRMPWHDVHSAVDGEAAMDMVKNFVLRWNHVARKFKKDPIAPFSRERLLRNALIEHDREFANDKMRGPKEINPLNNTGVFPNMEAQIVRSSGWWSSGLVDTETSIYQAYQNLIRNARHYVYIENQFFVSSLGSFVKNRVVDALYHRIRKAIMNKEKFRVIIILPVHPAGSVKLASTRYIMKVTYDTINRGDDGLLVRLKKDFPDVNLKDYISFFSLRNYGYLYQRGSVAIGQGRECLRYSLSGKKEPFSLKKVWMAGDVTKVAGFEWGKTMVCCFVAGGNLSVVQDLDAKSSVSFEDNLSSSVVSLSVSEGKIFVFRECGNVSVFGFSLDGPLLLLGSFSLSLLSDSAKLIPLFAVAGPPPLRPRRNAVRLSKVTCATSLSTTKDEVLVWCGSDDLSLLGVRLMCNPGTGEISVSKGEAIKIKVSAPPKMLELCKGVSEAGEGGIVLCAGLSNGRVLCFDCVSHQPLWEYCTHLPIVDSLVLHPLMGDVWCASTESSSLSVISLKNPSEASLHTRHQGGVLSLSLSNAPYLYVFSGDSKGSIFISNAVTLEYVQFITTDSLQIDSLVSFSNSFVSVGANSLLWWGDDWWAEMEAQSPAFYHSTAGDVGVMIKHQSEEGKKVENARSIFTIGNWIGVHLRDGTLCAWEMGKEGEFLRDPDRTFMKTNPTEEWFFLVVKGSLHSRQELVCLFSNRVALFDENLDLKLDHLSKSTPPYGYRSGCYVDGKDGEVWLAGVNGELIVRRVDKDKHSKITGVRQGQKIRTSSPVQCVCLVENSEGKHIWASWGSGIFVFDSAEKALVNEIPTGGTIFQLLPVPHSSLRSSTKVWISSSLNSHFNVALWDSDSTPIISFPLTEGPPPRLMYSEGCICMVNEGEVKVWDSRSGSLQVKKSVESSMTSSGTPFMGSSSFSGAIGVVSGSRVWVLGEGWAHFQLFKTSNTEVKESVASLESTLLDNTFIPPAVHRMKGIKGFPTASCSTPLSLRHVPGSHDNVVLFKSPSPDTTSLHFLAMSTSRVLVYSLPLLDLLFEIHFTAIPVSIQVFGRVVWIFLENGQLFSFSTTSHELAEHAQFSELEKKNLRGSIFLGNRLWTATEQGEIILTKWNANNFSFSVEKVVQSGLKRISSIQPSKCQQNVFVLSNEGISQFIGTDQLVSLTKSDDVIKCFCSLSGGHLAIGWKSGRLSLFRGAEGKFCEEVEAHRPTPLQSICSNRSETLLFSSETEYVCIWDFKKAKQSKELILLSCFSAHQGTVYQCSTLLPLVEGERFLTVGADGQLRVWGAKFGGAIVGWIKQIDGLKVHKQDRHCVLPLFTTMSHYPSISGSQEEDCPREECLWVAQKKAIHILEFKASFPHLSETFPIPNTMVFFDIEKSVVGALTSDGVVCVFHTKTLKKIGFFQLTIDRRIIFAIFIPYLSELWVLLEGGVVGIWGIIKRDQERKGSGLEEQRILSLEDPVSTYSCFRIEEVELKGEISGPLVLGFVNGSEGEGGKQSTQVWVGGKNRVVVFNGETRKVRARIDVGGTVANLEPIHFVKQVWCDCGGGKIVAFSSSTFRVIGSPGTKGHEVSLIGMQVSPQGLMIVTFDQKEICFWNSSTLNLITKERLDFKLSSVHFVGNDKAILIGEDGGFYIWEFETNSLKTDEWKSWGRLKSKQSSFMQEPIRAVANEGQKSSDLLRQVTHQLSHRSLTEAEVADFMKALNTDGKTAIDYLKYTFFSQQNPINRLKPIDQGIIRLGTQKDYLNVNAMGWLDADGFKSMRSSMWVVTLLDKTSMKTTDVVHLKNLKTGLFLSVEIRNEQVVWVCKKEPTQLYLSHYKGSTKYVLFASHERDPEKKVFLSVSKEGGITAEIYSSWKLSSLHKFSLHLSKEELDEKVVEPNPELVTEQVYVHAKVMIVDDLHAIIGSANINDRSMLGDRDSEIAVVITQSEKYLSEGKLGEEKANVSEYCKRLRLSLWRNHLGLKDTPENNRLIEDPVSPDTFWGVWEKVAAENTQIFEKIFANLPNEMKKYEDFCKGFKKDGKIPLTHTVRTKSPYLENAEAATFEMDRYIQQVQGHLVHFPLEFLEKSDLSLKKRNVEKLFPSALFI